MRLSLAVLFLCSLSAAAEPVERLFLSPAERDQLEKARERAIRPDQFNVPAVTGYIFRSDGRNTIWVDGVPYAATDLQLSQASRMGPQLPVRIRSSLGEPVRQKKIIPAKATEKP